jgi:hypothetical protein
VVSALSGQEGGGEAAFPTDFAYMDVCVEDAEDQVPEKKKENTPHKPTRHMCTHTRTQTTCHALASICIVSHTHTHAHTD